MGTRGFARGRLAARGLVVAFFLGGVASFVAAVVLSQGPAVAQTFTYDGYDWMTDRADTGSYTIGSFYGRDGVLNFEILSETTVPSNDSFYQYEGYKTVTGLPVAATFVSGDLFIPESWKAEAAAYQNVGLWATLGVAPGGPANSFPIVAFFNGDSQGGRVRIWAFDHWEDLPGANVNYDAWNTFRVNYLPGPAVGTGAFEMVVNGTVVATLTGGDFVASPVDPATDSQYELILNARTNGISPYDVYWSNLIFSLNEAYYNAASLVPTAIVAGDILMGTYVDRRGLDWQGEKSAWMRVVGADSSFDSDNGTIDSTIAGALFGLDLLAVGGPSTRVGVTGGYSSLSSDVTMPGGVDAGSTDTQSPSVGAYITHASETFYADLIGQYRFLDFDVTAPTSSDSVSGGSIDVAAEVGTHLSLANNVMLTPFVQINYQHVMLDDTTIGGLPVTFGDSDALIARARMLGQVGINGFNVFASAGVAGDLLGDKQTTVAGMTLASSTGGPRAEFTAGAEGTIGGFSIFGVGEIDVSFDGEMMGYLGRAGVRRAF